MAITLPHDSRVLKSALLRKQRVVVPASIPQSMLRFAEINSCVDDLADQMLYQLNTFMAEVEKSSENTVRSVLQTVAVPVTWWDHLKAEHAPAWFLKRWPANTRIIEVLQEVKTVTTHTRLCPHTEMDKDVKHVEWLAGAEDAPRHDPLNSEEKRRHS